MEKAVLFHGDCTLYKVDSIPAKAKELKWVKGFVLEKGEGVHTHTIEDECGLYEVDGVLYLKVETPIHINHEEHGLQTLEPGLYRKDLEREFDYEDMEARNTRD
uniref:Uncharacterized protein n=1 Tax=viral metagenome TaxID=1070528 RepID=A0A6M3ITL2_9ZZZZ